MTTSTMTRQQAAARALLTILAHDGLAETTWTVYPGHEVSSIPELVGQIQSRRPLAEARMLIETYAIVFDLTVLDELELSGTDRCAAFTEVQARGEVDGVRVHVWCAAVATVKTGTTR